ncbi:MAG: glycoside hydrolase family 10 protein [Limisphaerales bacterium]
MIHTNWFKSALAAALLSSTTLVPQDLPAQQSPQVSVPDVPREFRGAWIASVSNIDWPSSRNLTPAQQQKELIQILDRVAQLRMNAVVLQIRPMCDALYNSNFEPWSEYLTGKQGQPPSPYYDPLAFAVAEAHKRGLELHAWFNPYRAGLSSGKNFAPTHISKTRPHLVRTYGKYLWLDPGEPEVQLHSLNVIMDVVKRYDIDGIHFDDYFYPYKENDASGKPMDFPDEPSWQKYRQAGGKLDRNDWRRENVNYFLQRVHTEIKKQKPWVKFGLSPFGIWRPGNPPSVRGLDAYSSLYADSRKWLAEGYCDYFAPQLYWNIDAKEQSFPQLLDWWVKQNKKNIHIWPGISSARIGDARPAKEIINQVDLTRKQDGATGNIFWSVKSLMRNQGGLTDLVSKELYTEPALIPASPWMGKAVPRQPSATIKKGASTTQVSWRPTGGNERVALWVVQQRVNGKWFTNIIPGNVRSVTVAQQSAQGTTDVVAVRAVNRFGHASQPEVVAIR